MATNRAVGLYIHIPFCTGKCAYCDFYSLPAADAETRAVYLQRLKRELVAFSKIKKEIDTVYLGGGTPGILTQGELGDLLNTVFSTFSVSTGTEFTVEVNPNVHLPFRTYRQLGVNRVSIGIQTLDENGLRYAGRRHTASDSLRALEEAADAFPEVSADLIIGLPKTTPETVLRDLQSVVPYVTHLSAYLLKVEEGTPFANRLATGAMTEWIEDDIVKTYEDVLATAEKLGLNRYEISNFAHKGHESRHNLKYWRGEEYLGAGAAAHSFVGGVRLENPRSLVDYLAAPAAGEGGGARTEIPSSERLFERVMLGLRLEEGIDPDLLGREYGIDFDKHYAAALKETAPLLIRDGSRLKLKRDAFLLQSWVAEKFL